ncbi:MAG: macro domain-containing protein [Candidatus Aureabacteria bacterium]|nr:macro domain-containing protein [Candidatus Auribacterota bacterium]
MDTAVKTTKGKTSIELLLGDISNQDTEAIVNAANRSLTPGSGVSGAIHSVAGPELYEACQKVAPVETGNVVITPGFHLPNPYVFHTVGPFYQGGGPAESTLLARCYENCLKLAEKNNIRSIAFPSISTGIYGYPKKDAAEIAFSSIKKFATGRSTISVIRIVVFDMSSFVIHKKAFKKIFNLK